MNTKNIIFTILICFLVTKNGWPQASDKPIEIFGYFQTTLEFEEGKDIDKKDTYKESFSRNSFYLQHLNVFLRKDLAKNWTSFINFEFYNSYSSQKKWGGFNIEEAWINYYRNENMNFKIGLQIPKFNHLNELKNRTPVLPYIIRPLVYESSFSEFIKIDEFVPRSAFLQLYGFKPVSGSKFDYALYLGNSPQVNNDPDHLGITGIDLSETMLVGGRLGLRIKDLKCGLSFTNDNVAIFENLAMSMNDPKSYKDAPRKRLGADLSFSWRKISFESEYIDVEYNEKGSPLQMSRTFYYGVLGYQLQEQTFIYSGFFYVKDLDFHYDPVIAELFIMNPELEITCIGISYLVNERLTFKSQFSNVNALHNLVVDPIFDRPPAIDYSIQHIAFAFSVFF